MIREKGEARNHTFSGVHPQKRVTPRIHLVATKLQSVPLPPQRPRRCRPSACPGPFTRNASPDPLKRPVGAGLVPALRLAKSRHPIAHTAAAPSHLTPLAPNWILRFFEQLRGFTGFAEQTLLCVSGEADLVRQDPCRAHQRFRARIPDYVRGPGPDQLCGEYLLREPTRP